MHNLSHLALVSQTDQVPGWQVQTVAAALQKQCSRDFEPIWGIHATVNAFDILDDVPTGYWPVIIRDDIGFPGAAGIHLDDDGQPFGLVQATNTWTLTASHEVLEMLADPLGNRLRAGPSIKPDQGRVEFLVEVCDPSEDIQFGYHVNGVQVSDFYTPDFFLPRVADNVRYSFTGAIAEPRTILENGYISWLDPATGSWWQQIWFGPEKELVELGPLTGAGSFRTQIDEMTFRVRKDRNRAPSLTGLPEDRPELGQQKKHYDGVNAAARGKAKRLQERVDKLRRA